MAYNLIEYMETKIRMTWQIELKSASSKERASY